MRGIDLFINFTARANVRVLATSYVTCLAFALAAMQLCPDAAGVCRGKALRHVFPQQPGEKQRER